MVRHIPVLRRGVPSEEPSGPADFHQAALASLHHAAPLAQRARRPDTENEGGGPGSGQPQLQEDEEDSDG